MDNSNASNAIGDNQSNSSEIHGWKIDDESQEDLSGAIGVHNDVGLSNKLNVSMSKVFSLTRIFLLVELEGSTNHDIVAKEMSMIVTKSWLDESDTLLQQIVGTKEKQGRSHLIKLGLGRQLFLSDKSFIRTVLENIRSLKPFC